MWQGPKSQPFVPPGKLSQSPAMRSQPHKLTLLVELEKSCLLVAYPTDVLPLAWILDTSKRRPIKRRFGLLQGICRREQLDFSLVKCSLPVCVPDWKELKLLVYQQNNCQLCDQLSGERLVQEIWVHCFAGPVHSNLLMSVKIGFDLLLEALDSMCNYGALAKSFAFLNFFLWWTTFSWATQVVLGF